MPISSYALEIQGIEDKYQLNIEHHRNGYNRLAILHHGYLNHCRYLDVLADKLNEWKYDVVCMDLPGHGKSSGEKFDIDHFKTYSIATKETIANIQGEYKEIVFIAHSTGAVGMTDLLLDQEYIRVDKIIFIAPLIRSYLYRLSYWSWRIAGRVLPRLPVRPLGEVHPEYRALVESDPHYPKTVPSHFAGELFNWNLELEQLVRKSEQEIFIFFGTQDTVIDTDYNRNFYQTHFPQAKIQELQGSNHLFFHHNQNIREDFFSKLNNIL